MIEVDGVKIYKVFIDPGHGGSEPGAINDKVKEKDINLTVALRLKHLLLARGCFQVKMSRESDVYVSLDERSIMADTWGADMFISIHHNAGGGDGYEVIHSIVTGPDDKLAELIGEEFSKLGQNKSKIFTRESQSQPGKDYYSVLRKTLKVPAKVITEYAYLDTKDFEAIDTLEEQYAEAEALYKAICRFYNVSFNVPHWGEQHREFLNSVGFNIKDTRYNDPMTRAEAFALARQTYEVLRKELVKAGVLSDG